MSGVKFGQFILHDGGGDQKFDLSNPEDIVVDAETGEQLTASQALERDSRFSQTIYIRSKDFLGGPTGDVALGFAPGLLTKQPVQAPQGTKSKGPIRGWGWAALAAVGVGLYYHFTNGDKKKALEVDPELAPFIPDPERPGSWINLDVPPEFDVTIPDSGLGAASPDHFIEIDPEVDPFEDPGPAEEDDDFADPDEPIIEEGEPSFEPHAPGLGPNTFIIYNSANGDPGDDDAPAPVPADDSGPGPTEQPADDEAPLPPGGFPALEEDTGAFPIEGGGDDGPVAALAVRPAAEPAPAAAEPEGWTPAKLRECFDEDGRLIPERLRRWLPGNLAEDLEVLPNAAIGIANVEGLHSDRTDIIEEQIRVLEAAFRAARELFKEGVGIVLKFITGRIVVGVGTEGDNRHIEDENEQAHNAVTIYNFFQCVRGIIAAYNATHPDSALTLNIGVTMAPLVMGPATLPEFFTEEGMEFFDNGVGEAARVEGYASSQAGDGDTFGITGPVVGLLRERGLVPFGSMRNPDLKTIGRTPVLLVGNEPIGVDADRALAPELESDSDNIGESSSVIMAVLDLVNSMGMNEFLETAEDRVRFNYLIHAIALDVFEKYPFAQVEKQIGDAVMVRFLLSPDNATRLAVEACLEFQAEIDRYVADGILPPQTQFRMAIEELEGAYFRHRTVDGDVVYERTTFHPAMGELEKLDRHAPPGELWVGPRAKRHVYDQGSSNNLVEVREVFGFPVDVDGGVIVEGVDAEAVSRQVEEQYAIPPIGRTEEMDAVRESLGDAGVTVCVASRADEGSGMNAALKAELAEGEEGLEVLDGNIRGGRRDPLQVALQKRVLGNQDHSSEGRRELWNEEADRLGLDEETRQVLGIQLGVPADEGFQRTWDALDITSRRDRLVDAWQNYMRALGDNGRVVLTINNLDLADEETLRILTRVLTGLSQNPGRGRYLLWGNTRNLSSADEIPGNLRTAFGDDDAPWGYIPLTFPGLEEEHGMALLCELLRRRFPAFADQVSEDSVQSILSAVLEQAEVVGNRFDPMAVVGLVDHLRFDEASGVWQFTGSFQTVEDPAATSARVATVPEEGGDDFDALASQTVDRLTAFGSSAMAPIDETLSGGEIPAPTASTPALIGPEAQPRDDDADGPGEDSLRREPSSEIDLTRFELDLANRARHLTPEQQALLALITCYAVHNDGEFTVDDLVAAVEALNGEDDESAIGRYFTRHRGDEDYLVRQVLATLRDRGLIRPVSVEEGRYTFRTPRLPQVFFDRMAHNYRRDFNAVRIEELREALDADETMQTTTLWEQMAFHLENSATVARGDELDRQLAACEAYIRAAEAANREHRVGSVLYYTREAARILAEIQEDLSPEQHGRLFLEILLQRENVFSRNDRERWRVCVARIRDTLQALPESFADEELMALRFRAIMAVGNYMILMKKDPAVSDASMDNDIHVEWFAHHQDEVNRLGETERMLYAFARSRSYLVNNQRSEAETMLDVATGLAVGIDDPETQRLALATRLYEEARDALSRGSLVEAYDLLQRCIPALRAVGDWLNLVPALNRLANTAIDLALQLPLGPERTAYFHRAVEAYREALEMAEVRRNIGQLTWTQTNLAMAQAELEHYGEAERLLREALGMARDHNLNREMAEATLQLAIVLATHDYDGAIDVLEDNWDDVSDDSVTWFDLNFVRALAHFRRGEFASAQEFLAEAYQAQEDREIDNSDILYRIEAARLAEVLEMDTSVLGIDGVLEEHRDDVLSAYFGDEGFEVDEVFEFEVGGEEGFSDFDDE